MELVENIIKNIESFDSATDTDILALTAFSQEYAYAILSQ